MPVNFFVSGSINSLDFIPGGGFSAQIAGIGPRYRQNRILVALDLTLTDAYTGRIVANVPLQKQIFTQEYGGGGNTFFGNTLVQLEAGGMEREALHFALRQMLSFATIELLGQLMQPEVFKPCRDKVEASTGVIQSIGTADAGALAAALRSAREEEANPPAPPLAIPVSDPDALPAQAGEAQQAQAAGAAQAQQRAQAAASQQMSEAQKLGQLSTVAATDAIRAARDSENAADRTESMKRAADALQKSNDALRLLQKAAELGFSGDEGEVAAVVVQQALQAAQKAGTAAAGRTTAPAAAPIVPAPDMAAPQSVPVDDTGSAMPAGPQAPPQAQDNNLAPGPLPQGGPRQDKRNMGAR